MLANRIPPLLVLLAAALSAGCVTRRGASAGGRDRAADETGALPETSTELPVAPPLSSDPIILPGRGAIDPSARGAGAGGPSDSKARRKVDQDDAAFREKFEAAQGAAAAGEDEIALTLISSALEANPKSPWDQRFRALKADVKSRHLDANVLRLDVRPIRDYVGFEEDVDLLVRLRNVGDADVVIRAAEGFGADAVSGSTLVLTMKRTDRDIYAAEMSHSWTQSVPLLAPGDRELRIAPEGVHEMRVRVPADEVGGPISGMKVLDLSGEMRAGRILSGIEEPFGRIALRPGRVVALPANFEPLAADPLGSISRAVDALAPVHLLVATEFLAPEDWTAAVGMLARSLATTPVEMRPAALNALDLLRRAAAGTPLRPLAAPLMDALAAHPDRASDLMEGLHVLTLVSLPPDVRLWDDWWRRQQKGRGALVEAEDTSPARTARAPSATDATPRFTPPSAPR